MASEKVRRGGGSTIFDDVRIFPTVARPQGYPVAGEFLLAKFTDIAQTSRIFTLSDYLGIENFVDLILRIRRLVPGTDDRQVYLQIDNNTAAVHSMDYTVRSSTGHAAQGATGQTQIFIGDTTANEAFGSAPGEVGQIDITFYDWQDTSRHQQIGIVTRARNAAFKVWSAEGGATYPYAAKINIIKFFMEASSTYSAILSLYGRR